MEDKKIIEMFFERSEEAISRLYEKYGAYCRSIAKNILQSEEDAEECINDAFLTVWNSIPPQKPEKLGAYAGKITRNFALNKAKYNAAEKRGGGKYEEALSELEECIASKNDTESCIDKIVFKETVEAFLLSQPEEKRNIFIRRYWYLQSVSELSAAFGFSESKIKSLLMRMRSELRKKLEKEDFI